MVRSDPNRPHVVYRFWGTDDALLYVGLSASPGIRWQRHSVDKPWWTDVVKVTLEHFATFAEARAAEVAAIKSERPRFNLAEVPKVASPRPRIGSLTLLARGETPAEYSSCGKLTLLRQVHVPGCGSSRSIRAQQQHPRRRSTRTGWRSSYLPKGITQESVVAMGQKLPVNGYALIEDERGWHALVWTTDSAYLGNMYMRHYRGHIDVPISSARAEELIAFGAKVVSYRPQQRMTNR